MFSTIFMVSIKDGAEGSDAYMVSFSAYRAYRLYSVSGSNPLIITEPFPSMICQASSAVRAAVPSFAQYSMPAIGVTISIIRNPAFP